MDPTGADALARTNPGQSTPDSDDLREVKVKLPVDQVLRLHYARMKRRQNFSAIVSSALTRYLDDLSKP